MKLAAMKDDTENLVFLIGIIKKTLINLKIKVRNLPLIFHLYLIS